MSDIDKHPCANEQAAVVALQEEDALRLENAQLRVTIAQQNVAQILISIRARYGLADIPYEIDIAQRRLVRSKVKEVEGFAANGVPDIP